MIELILYSLSGCMLCSEVFRQLTSCLEANPHVARKIRMVRVGYEYDPRGQDQVHIRVFPTLIAYKNGTPRLGWEGFAAMEPSEIQEALVMDVLRQAAELADEDIPATCLEA